MRLKIAAQIGLGFGIVLLAVIVNSFVTSKNLNESRKVNDKIINVYNPSLHLINTLHKELSDSRMLIKAWVHIDKKDDTPDKMSLRRLHSIDFPEVMDSINTLSELWPPEHQELIKVIETTIKDTLFPMHQSIMADLSTFDSYEDFFIVSMATMMVEENGDVIVLTDKIIDLISQLEFEQENLVLEGNHAMISAFDKFRQIIIIMLLSLIFVSVFIGIFTIRSLVIPINKTKNMLLTMSKGEIPETQLGEGNDEIGQMGKALNMLVQSLKNIAEFALQIGKGNFDSDYKAQSEEDMIGKSLIQMRDELQKAKLDEEKRQEEVRQRNWASQGVALFSDILRQNNDDLEKLSYEIISNMVSYTSSNQGGFFLINDNDTDNMFIELIACYAYDRQKFLEKKIEIGEGLVGRCYQEGEKIFLTDLPSNYIKITSGLGEDNPKCLLLVPLMYNDIIYGIMEIASFNIYEPYIIEFIERIGESIAATISSVKSNIQTTELLERTRMQAEEMHAQEEEMRQNMEELRATQEQSTRREEELQRELENLKKRVREMQSLN